MARTAEEIAQQILDDIAADPILSLELTSLSKTAFYILLADIYGQQAHAIELAWDVFSTETETRLLNQIVGTPPWYSSKSQLYQHGDTLIYNGNGQYSYATVDETLQIIERVAVVVSGTIVLLKIAKLVAGVVTPLDAAELAGFTSYWDTVDFVPSFLQILSATPDDIRLTFTATLDPQLFNTTTGELLIGGDKAVETAIQNYLDTFTNDNFDGTFYLSELIGNILLVPGVVNIVFSVAEAKEDAAGVYTDIILAAGKKYNTFAGYFKDAVLTPNYN